MGLNRIYNTDALEGLKGLKDNSIDCVVTSPPYWALRDYGVTGQLGLEPTFQEYITKLCDIFDEVKRVLKKQGTCWVNLGDTYGTTSGGMEQLKKQKKDTPQYGAIPYADGYEGVDQSGKRNMKMEKCLLQIPSRFAIEMTNRGWILRNRIIWHKANVMPSSANDRFTVDFEEIFFFVKNKKYWFEQQFDKTITKDNSNRDRDNTKLNNTPGRTRMSGLKTNNYEFKNKRTTWFINPKPFSEAHFAVFPEKLIETPIKAGCPEFICKKCGKAREKIFDKEVTFHSGSGKTGNQPKGKWEGKEQQESGDYDIRMGPKVERTDKGYSNCGCNAEFEGGIVLDPFMGSGTTAVVAKKFNRNYLGFEINKEYIDIAENRLYQELGLFI